jgi:hypothetical protein
MSSIDCRKVVREDMDTTMVKGMTEHQENMNQSKIPGLFQTHFMTPITTQIPIKYITFILYLYWNSGEQNSPGP